MNDKFIYTMTQFLKDHIRDAIIDAALNEFAQHGFSGASVAGIAARSGISTGNVYRYFSSKAKLFEAAIPNSFVQKLMKKLRKRVDAYPIGTRPEVIPEHSSYLKLSEELLDFTIANRLRVLIVFEGSAGTPYETFTPNLLIELTKKAIHVLKLAKIADNPTIVFALLEDLYRNYLLALGSILRQFSDESDIRSAVRILSAYHLGGLAMIAQ